MNFIVLNTCRRLWTAGASLILGMLIASASAAESPVRIKVMSYNIRIGVGGREWTTDPCKINLEPVARLVAEHAPDLAGIQEVDQHRPRTAGADQPGWLGERLGMKVAFVPAYTVPHGDAPEERYGVALLSRWPVEERERIALFKPDYSRREPKYPDYFSEQRVLMRAQVTAGSRRIQVFVTHLGLTADQRENQIKQIAAAAAAHPGPKILMGDFNAEPAEPAMSQLQGVFMDALSVAAVSAAERKSFPAGLKPRGSIDYVFVSPEFRVLSARVIRDATLASDHNPVVVELELP